MKEIFLVDADDTVLDFHGVSELAIQEAFKELSIPWQEEYMSKYRSVNDSLWQALEQKELTREKLMARRFHFYFAHLGMPEVDAEKFNKKYLEILSTRPIYFQGAEAFLEELRRRGRIYIVTNGTAKIQESRFSICKLYEKVDGVFVSELIGADKPDKTYTDYVTSHIDGFEREKAIWIGDSLSADIKGAKEGEIDSIWLNFREKSLSGGVKPTFQATSYEEILKILDRI